MIRLQNLLFLLLSIFLFSNCTSISLKMVGATIESPEVAGKGQKEMGPSLEPARGVEYTSSVSSRPPDLNNAEALGTTHALLHQARFGLGDKFELGGQVGLDFEDDVQTTFMLVGKYQIFGPTKEKAKAGDASAGIHGRISYANTNSSGNQQDTFGPGGFPWSADVNALMTMAGMSFGYRLADSILFYLGGSYQHVMSTVKVDQDPASDNSDQGGRYTRDRDGRSIAYGLGVQFRLGKVFYLHGKLMQHEFYLDGVPGEQGLWGGGGFHFYW